MLAVDPDSLASALARLDPGSRALLDLSLRRGLEDAEIAEFLGTGPAEVADRRSRLLEDLAREAGATTPEEVAEARRILVDLDAFQSPAAERESAPATERRSPPSRQAERADQVRDSRSRGGLLVAGILGLVVLGVVIAILASSAGDDPSPRETSTSPATTTTGTAASTQTTPAVEAVRLRALGPKGGGTASIDGDRLKLRVKGLPDLRGGSYEIWLYNSIEDANSIASFGRTSIDLDARLPAEPSRFRYVDISLEPKDGNKNHSGQSLLRVPLSRLGSG